MPMERQAIRSLDAPGVNPRMPTAPDPIGDALQTLLGQTANTAQAAAVVKKQYDDERIDAETRTKLKAYNAGGIGALGKFDFRKSEEDVLYAIASQEASKFATDEAEQQAFFDGTDESLPLETRVRQWSENKTYGWPANATRRYMEGIIPTVGREVARRRKETTDSTNAALEDGIVANISSGNEELITTGLNALDAEVARRPADRAAIYNHVIRKSAAVLTANGEPIGAAKLQDYAKAHDVEYLAAGITDAARAQYATNIMSANAGIMDDSPSEAPRLIKQANDDFTMGLLDGAGRAKVINAVKTKLDVHATSVLYDMVSAGYTIAEIDQYIADMFPDQDDGNRRQALRNIGHGGRTRKIKADIYDKVFSADATDDDVQAAIDAGKAETALDSEDELEIKTKIDNYRQLADKAVNIESVLAGERLYLDPEKYNDPLIDYMIKNGWAKGIRAKANGANPIWGSVEPVHGPQVADALVQTRLLPDSIADAIAANIDNDDAAIYLPALAEYAQLEHRKHPRIGPLFSSLSQKGQYRVTLLQDALKQDQPDWNNATEVSKTLSKYTAQLDKVRPVPYTRQQLAKLPIKDRDIYDKKDVTEVERVAVAQDFIADAAPPMYKETGWWHARLPFAPVSPVIAHEWYEYYLNHVGAYIAIGMTTAAANSKASKNASSEVLAMHPPRVVDGVVELTFEKASPQLQPASLSDLEQAQGVVGKDRNLIEQWLRQRGKTGEYERAE